MKRILAALTFCLVASQLHATDLLPLVFGSYWVYRHDPSGETFTIRVGQPVWTNSGKTYHYLLDYAGPRVIARVDEAGNLVMLDEETGQERLLTAFGTPPSKWWEAPNRECAQQGQTARERVDYRGPAGPWARTQQVRYRSTSCADTGVTMEQFAGNIGMLRREVTTIAGPKMFELVYARVGTQIIETQDRARFSVAVEQPSERGPLRVSLRIDLGYVPAIRLRFPTAQEYDVVVRDIEGKIVWRWSDDQVFEQSAREKQIGNLWSATVTVPRPPGDMQGYTIEGWLTTAPGEPKFAATAPAPPPRIDPPAANH